MSRAPAHDLGHPTIVQRSWDRLRRVTSLTFAARSGAPMATGWVGTGRGVVVVEQPTASTLLFRESGDWTPASGRSLRFSNTFRWTIDGAGASLRLEHLRLGPADPVFLFDLVPAGDEVLESAGPHACRRDAYTMRMVCDGGPIRVGWAVDGPGKSEAIDYEYE